MTLAILRAMIAGFIRDRGALALSFLLPAAFFVVFAAIFSGVSGDAPRLTIAIADLDGGDSATRLIRALAAENALTLVTEEGKKAPPSEIPTLDADDVRRLVQSGAADVGLIVRPGVDSFGKLFGEDLLAPAPLTLVSDPARGIASQIVAGLLQKSYFAALPDVAAREAITLFDDEVAPLTEEQRARAKEAVDELRPDAADPAGDGDAGDGLEGLFEVEEVAGRSAGRDQIAYYAGAVAVLFMLISAARGAEALLEERESGILDRFLAGPARMAPLLLGKFSFLVALGVAQQLVIFAVAWAIGGLDLFARFGGFLITAVATAAAAGGLALAIVAACSSRRQAHSLATIVMLILSAVGGSMVPRFLMPPLVRSIGWLTPNAWSLEAYTRLFWRDEPIVSIALPVLVLLAVAAAGLGAARLLVRRWESI